MNSKKYFTNILIVTSVISNIWGEYVKTNLKQKKEKTEKKENNSLL